MHLRWFWNMPPFSFFLTTLQKLLGTRFKRQREEDKFDCSRCISLRQWLCTGNQVIPSSSASKWIKNSQTETLDFRHDAWLRWERLNLSCKRIISRRSMIQTCCSALPSCFSSSQVLHFHEGLQLPWPELAHIQSQLCTVSLAASTQIHF